VTGELMDDAMLLSCGHSVGKGGLRRVMETNVCITCGASVLTETMTPNYGNEFVILWNSYHILVSQMLLRICKGNASECT
jgi:hypothetical protein